MKPLHGRIKIAHLLSLFSTLTLALLLTLTAMIVFWRTDGFLDQKADEIYEIKVNQVTASVRSSLESVVDTMDYFGVSGFFRDAMTRLENSERISYGEYILSNNIYTTLANIRKNSDLIRMITVLTEHYQFSSDGTMTFGYQRNDALLSLLENNCGMRVIAKGATYRAMGLEGADVPDARLRTSLDRLNRTSYVLSALAPSGEDGLRGIVMIELDFDSLSAVNPYAGSMALQDAEGNVLYCGRERTSSGRAEDARRLNLLDVRLVFEPDNSLQGGQSTRILRICLATIVGCLISSMVLGRFLGAVVLSPIHRLTRWLEKEEGQACAAEGETPLQALKKPGQDSIRARLFLYFIGTILLPLALFVVCFYSASSRMVSEELIVRYRTTLDKTADQISLFLRQKESMLLSLSCEPAMIDFADGSQDADRLDALKQLLLTHRYFSLKNDIFSIYDQDGSLVYSNRTDQYGTLPAAFRESMPDSGMGIVHYIAANSSFTTNMGIAIWNLDYALPVGSITVNVADVYFSDLFLELGRGGNVSLLDGAGGVLLSSDKTGTAAAESLKPLGESDGLYFVAQVGGTPYRLAYHYDSSDVHRQLQNLIIDDVYLLLIVFLLILLIAYGASRYLVSSIRVLQSGFEEIWRGNAAAFTPRRAYWIDEIDTLQMTFYRLLCRIKTLSGDMIEAERHQTAMRLDVLKAQITPHFLYNTLEHVMVLVDKNQGEQANEMIGLLSRLFRYAMGKEASMVTVEEEVRSTHIYIHIMQIRYNDRVRCVWEVDDRARDGCMLKMALQPILENAIRYSLTDSLRTVAIVIGIAREADDILITVRDDGSGIPPERLREIRQNMGVENQKSLGLYNLHSRLRLYFGPRYGVEIDSVTARGTTVTLRLPYRRCGAAPEDCAGIR